MNTPDDHHKVLFVTLLPYFPEHRDGISKINYNLLKLSPQYDFLSFAREEECKKTPLQNNSHSVIYRDDLVQKNKVSRFFSRSPLPKIKNKFKKEFIEKIIELEPAYDVLFFSGPQMVEILEKLPRRIQLKSILSLIDSISLYWKRRSQNSQSPFLKIIYFFEYLKSLHFEKSRAAKARIIHFVSDVDLNFSLKHISQKSILKCITNGVSFNRTQPKEKLNTKELLFIGNFSYGPNHQAAQFLIDNLMPSLLKKNNSYSLTLAGPNLDPSLRSRIGKGIQYLGFVEDIESVYDHHSVFLSPLFYGSGIKNKVLEAMLKGLIVVGTPLSFDNISNSGELDRIVIDSKDEANWVSAILNLEADHNLLTISKGAQALTKSQFSWDSKSLEYSKMFFSIMESER